MNDSGSVPILTVCVLCIPDNGGQSALGRRGFDSRRLHAPCHYPVEREALQSGRSYTRSANESDFRLTKALKIDLLTPSYSGFPFPSYLQITN